MKIKLAFCKQNNCFCFFFVSRRTQRYEEFGISDKVSQEEPADDASTPDSTPEPERPPLRHIDKYIRPECPCLSKRVTVALLTCLGFIVMFGMRCNMGMAKLELEENVRLNF